MRPIQRGLKEADWPDRSFSNCSTRMRDTAVNPARKNSKIQGVIFQPDGDRGDQDTQPQPEADLLNIKLAAHQAQATPPHDDDDEKDSHIAQPELIALLGNVGKKISQPTDVEDRLWRINEAANRNENCQQQGNGHDCALVVGGDSQQRHEAGQIERQQHEQQQPDGNLGWRPEACPA